MHPKSPKLLDDVVRSCQRIQDFTEQLTLDQYETERMVRDAVERNLIIVGEALSRLERVDIETATQISGFRQIMALRHRLAHGYDDDIDDARIWTAIRDFFPALMADAERLLESAESAYEDGTL
jgi:uncharacterized protein with HEPN domain